jgi:hypothetical protein
MIAITKQIRLSEHITAANRNRNSANCVVLEQVAELCLRRYRVLAMIRPLSCPQLPVTAHRSVGMALRS